MCRIKLSAMGFDEGVLPSDRLRSARIAHGPFPVLTTYWDVCQIQHVCTISADGAFPCIVSQLRNPG